MFLRVLALTLAFALPAAAEAICDPPRGTALTVSGVAANDTLNMRREPNARADVVSRIAPNERGVTATGRAAWARGQCTTTCQGAEGGLNDTGRSIAFGCKARGDIWYEVRRSNGSTGWSNARYLDLASAPPTTPSRPVVQSRLTFTCGRSGRMTVEIHRGGQTADVTIGRQTFRVERRDDLFINILFQSRDGARLRGNTSVIEWRWPNGERVICSS
jgi:SH3-like domain-containing protein